MLFPILFLMIVALALSLPMTALVIRAARQLDLTDKPEDPLLVPASRKWHGRPIPNTGGVAIFLAVILPIIVGLGTLHWAPDIYWQGWLAPVAEHLPGLRQQTSLALAVLGGAAVLHGLGLIDDRRRLGPWSKLGVQAAVATVLAVVFDVRILEMFTTWWGIGGMVLSVVLTVIWVLAITNAMNFLDNMDGLSGGIGAIIAGIYMAANLVGGQWFVAALAALLLGALLGFLVFNFHPAKIFMGDGGSLVLGFLLAMISIRTTYVFSSDARPSLTTTSLPQGYGIFMPLVVMAVPLYDLCSVTLIRLSKGQSPMVGDRNHFSHRLVRMGLSQRSAVLVIWLCTLATGLGGVMLRTLTTWQAMLVAAQTLAILLVLAMLERGAGREFRNEHRL